MVKNVIFLVVFSMTITPACALSVRIPALDRVRKNVESALHDGTKAIVTQGNKLVSALGFGDDNKTLSDVAKILDGLKWSPQQELVKKIFDLKKESPTQVTHFLKEIIKTQCSSSRMPLVTFAQELAHEEQQLNSAFSMILQCASEKNRMHRAAADELQRKIKVQSDRHAAFLQTLHQLIDVANVLLMG